jgi:transposase
MLFSFVLRVMLRPLAWAIQTEIAAFRECPSPRFPRRPYKKRFGKCTDRRNVVERCVNRLKQWRGTATASYCCLTLPLLSVLSQKPKGRPSPELLITAGAAERGRQGNSQNAAVNGD